MVIIPEYVHEKFDKEIKKFPPELIEKIAKAIHKYY